MGIVYRAKWRETDVAVKRLKRSHEGDDSDLQMQGDFVREVALLKRLRHPHVVLFMGWFLSSSSYLAADAQQSSLCFVTELCWTSLYHLLHTTSNRNSVQLHWASPPCARRGAGCALHGEGIIHVI